MCARGDWRGLEIEPCAGRLLRLALADSGWDGGGGGGGAGGAVSRYIPRVWIEAEATGKMSG